MGVCRLRSTDRSSSNGINGFGPEKTLLIAESIVATIPAMFEKMLKKFINKSKTKLLDNTASRKQQLALSDGSEKGMLARGMRDSGGKSAFNLSSQSFVNQPTRSSLRTPSPGSAPAALSSCTVT